MKKLLPLLMLASAPAFAQFVAGNAQQRTTSGGTNPTVTLTGCGTAGANFIVAYVTNGNDATTVAVSSTSVVAGNWHHGSNVLQGSSTNSALWYGYAASLSNSETVSLGSNVWNASLTAQCFAGAAASNQKDQASTHICSDGSTLTSTCSTTSITPTQAGELVIAVNYAASSQSISGGFTPSVTCTGVTRCMGYLIQGSPAAASPTFSFANGYNQDASQLMSFFTASAPVDYTVTGPSSGYVYTASTNFTITKSSGSFSGSQAISIADGAQGGTVTPQSGCGTAGTTPLTITPPNGSSSCTFTYTPAATGALTLAFTGAGMAGQNPASLGYTSNPLALSLACNSATGLVNVASDTCTVSVTGASFNGSMVVTLSDSGETPGGTFTPSVGSPFTSSGAVAPPNGTSFTFTYTPIGPVGIRTFVVTNSFNATNPGNMTYTATSGDACTFTAKASGNWNAAGTWTPSACTGGGHTTPTTGDTVTVGAYTVTCTTGMCYMGTAPANNTTYDLTIASGGSLVVASGATLWLTGNYKLNSNQNATPAVLQVQTGGTFTHDNNNSSSVSYRGIGGASGKWNNVIMGTAGDTCTWSASYAYSCPTTYQGANVSGGKYPSIFSTTSLSDDITYQIFGAAVRYCGTTTAPCLDDASAGVANGYANAGLVDVENSVFDHTSAFGSSNAGTGGTSINHLTWVNNRELADVKGFAGINADNFFVALGGCTITGNFFDAQASPGGNDYGGGCFFKYNVFSNGWGWYGGSSFPWGAWTGNVTMLTASETLNEVQSTSLIDNIWYQELSSPGSAHMAPFQPDINNILVGNIGMRGGVVSESHCGNTSTATSSHKTILLDNLAPMNASGDPGCEWWGNIEGSSGIAGMPLYADHNGENGLATDTWFGFLGHSGNYYSTGAFIRSFRANIGWSPSAGSHNLQIADWQGSGVTPNTLVDATTVIDWNNNYNATASSLFGAGYDTNCNPSTFNGTTYQLCSNTAGPGAHETAVDPKYIDTTRRLETWASRVMGQAQTSNGARAALWGCASLPSCIGSLETWIRRGWQPTNLALKGKAHDGKIIGFSGTYGSGYSGTCGVTITPKDAGDLGGTIPAHAATATCAFAGGVPQITLTNGGAHYRIANPATIAITCGGCTPTVPASLAPIIQPSDIGPVPIVVLASAL